MSETREQAAAMHEATDIGTKLTKPRRAMLEELHDRPGPYADHYPPLRWLWEKKLAEEYATGGYFRLTLAGSALLRSLKAKEERNG